MVTKCSRLSSCSADPQGVCLQTALTLAVACFAVTFPTTSVVAVESFWTSPSSGDWFDSQNWGGPIPNAPGDIAHLLGVPDANISVDLSSPVTLGQLDIFGQSAFSLTGPGPLFFDNPGADAAMLRIVSLPKSHVLAAPLGIADEEQLMVDVPSDVVLKLNGGIAAGNGNLVKKNGGRLDLSGASLNWDGTLTVDEGQIRIEHTKALLNSSVVTAKPNSVVTIVSQDATMEDSRDSYVIPRLQLDAATLRTNLGASRETTLLETNIELLSDSVIRVSTDDFFLLRGNISGPGGVSFQQRFDPTAPVGLIERTFLEINGATSYSGETIVGPNMRVNFRQAAALGDTNGGTLVQQGELQLSQGGGAEQIVVDRGRLHLGEAVDPYGHTVRMTAGNLTGGGDTPAELSTHVEFTDGALFGTESGGDNLLLADGVSGVGSVAIQNGVEIQGGLTARGNLYIRNRAGARQSGPLDLAGEVFIDRAGLRLNSNVGAPETMIRIAPTFETADAALTVARDNTFRSVILDPRASNRESTFIRSTVSAVNGAVLTITDEFRFLGGVVSGTIQGQSVLTKKDRTVGTLANIAGSGFERVNVEAGQLIVRGDVRGSAPDIHLLPHDTSRVLLDNTRVYPSDIYLNNAQGYSSQGALSMLGSTTLTGNIFLGEMGASLSAGGQGDSASIGSEAVIHGGDLTLRGRAPIRIRGDKHTYTGATKVMAESLILIDEGRLSSTSSVIGSGRFTGGGGRGSLVLDNTGTVGHGDRIPDSTPVHLNGMEFTLIGRTGATTAEFLGTVRAERGISDLMVENPDTANGSTSLVIENLDRQPGAMMKFGVNDPSARIIFVQAPTLDDALIGGWARFGREDFATYGPNGVVAYSDLHTYQTDITTATAADNVSLLGQQLALSADKNINALKTINSQIDLNGNILNIESGGLLGGSAQQPTFHGEGQLTAGLADGAELNISGNLWIDADITDNTSGAIGLTFSEPFGNNSAFLKLSGSNSYSGPTIVSSGTSLAILEVASETALPTGGDVFLNGGDLRVNHERNTPLELGHMELRDAALVRSNSDFSPQLQPESVIVDSGDFLLEIVGDAPITKIGPLNASFGNSLLTHSGPIFVEGGNLFVDVLGPAPLDDAHAITIHLGGRLQIGKGPTLPDRKIILDGGVLEFDRTDSLPGLIDITTVGGTMRNLAARNTPSIDSVVVGQGDLAVEGAFGDGRLDFNADLSGFQGDLLLTGGAISISRNNTGYNGLTQIAAENVTASGIAPFGSGQVTVLPEGQLIVGNPLQADLRLAGGVLSMQFARNLRAPRLTGKLSVADHSYLFIASGFDGNHVRPDILSDMLLEDGSNLTIAQAPGGFSDYQGILFNEHLRISTDLMVQGTATLTSFDTVVDLFGTIAPASQTAVLNLVGNGTFNLSASVQLSGGKSLSIFQDDSPYQFILAGKGKSLSGNGTLVNDVTLLNGAAVSPGNSAGELTVDGDANMGGGAVFEWEIANTPGIAGVDSDLWRINGELLFEATSNNPWVLEIIGLPGFDLLPSPPWLIASADSIDGFDPEAAEIDISGIVGSRPSLTPDQFRLYTQDGDLLLQFVPEPSSLMLAGLGIVLPFFRSRGLCHLK